MFVEKTNLTNHVSALRKTMGEGKNAEELSKRFRLRDYRFGGEDTESRDGETEIKFSERR